MKWLMNITTEMNKHSHIKRVAKISLYTNSVLIWCVWHHNLFFHITNSPCYVKVLWVYLLSVIIEVRDIIKVPITCISFETFGFNVIWVSSTLYKWMVVFMFIPFLQWLQNGFNFWYYLWCDLL